MLNTFKFKYSRSFSQYKKGRKKIQLLMYFLT